MAGRGRAPSERTAPDGLKPEGRNGGGREQVAEIQRARLLSAMTQVVSERGAANVTVARVVARSGVSRRTFYELFEDREECFLAAFDDGIARASRYVLDGYDPSARWAERIRNALTGLLSFLDVERGIGRLLIVGSLGAGACAFERRERVLAQMITAVEEGRAEIKTGNELPPLTAEGIVGGVLSVLHARLLQDDPGRLVALTGPLMAMVVLPYLGPAAARRELDRPLPKHRRRAPDASNGAGHLTDLPMRVTYRTLRVLSAVASRPGASNRQAGDSAGITDQGQISKLLHRLEKLGLLLNAGAGQARGTPNAWMLTARGREVHGAISEQTSS